MQPSTRPPTTHPTHHQSRARHQARCWRAAGAGGWRIGWGAPLWMGARDPWPQQPAEPPRARRNSQWRTARTPSAAAGAPSPSPRRRPRCAGSSPWGRGAKQGGGTAAHASRRRTGPNAAVRAARARVYGPGVRSTQATHLVVAVLAHIVHPQARRGRPRRVSVLFQRTPRHAGPRGACRAQGAVVALRLDLAAGEHGRRSRRRRRRTGGAASRDLCAAVPHASCHQGPACYAARAAYGNKHGGAAGDIHKAAAAGRALRTGATPVTRPVPQPADASGPAASHASSRCAAGQRVRRLRVHGPDLPPLVPPWPQQAAGRSWSRTANGRALVRSPLAAVPAAELLPARHTPPPVPRVRLERSSTRVCSIPWHRARGAGACAGHSHRCC